MRIFKTKKIVSVALGYVNIAIRNLFSFLLTPLMITMWGDSSYGLYKLLLSFMSYFILVDSGIKNSVIKFITKYKYEDNKQSERAYVMFILVFYLIAIAVLLLLVFAFSQIVPVIYKNSLAMGEIEIMIEVLPVVAFYTGGTLFYNCFTAIMRAYLKHISVQSFNISRSLIRILVILFMLNNGSSLQEVIICDTVISVAFGLLSILYVLVRLKVIPSIKGITLKFIKEIFSFAQWMLLNTLCFSLFWTIGVFILSLKTSTEVIAVYSIGVLIINVYQSMASAVSQVYMPEIMMFGYKNSNTNDLNKLMLKTTRIKAGITLLILLGFAIFGREFIVLWVGKNYTDAYLIAIMVLVPLFIGLLQDVPQNILYAKDRHKPLAIISLFSLIFNGFFSWLMIGFFGMIGAGISTAVSYTLFYVIISDLVFYKEFRFNMLRLYANLLIKPALGFIVISITGIAILLIPMKLSWVSFLIKVLLFTASYGLIYYFAILDKEQRIKIRRIVR